MGFGRRVQDAENALDAMARHRNNGDAEGASRALRRANQAAEDVTEQGGSLTRNRSEQLADANAWDLSKNHG